MNMPKQTFDWLNKLIFPSQKSIGLILAWYILVHNLPRDKWKVIYSKNKAMELQCLSPKSPVAPCNIPELLL